MMKDYLINAHAVCTNPDVLFNLKTKKLTVTIKAMVNAESVSYGLSISTPTEGCGWAPSTDTMGHLKEATDGIFNYITHYLETALKGNNSSSSLIPELKKGISLCNKLHNTISKTYAYNIEKFLQDKMNTTMAVQASLF